MDDNDKRAVLEAALNHCELTRMDYGYGGELVEAVESTDMIAQELLLALKGAGYDIVKVVP